MLSADSSLIDIAFAVCTALDRINERALLVGGSAATFYASAAYQSSDCDFILTFGATATRISEALASLKYFRNPEGFYRNPDLLITVEFPVGPAAIGMDIIEHWNTVRRDDQLLHVYTPNDVVRDRFLHFWAWGDYSALRVALDVAAATRDLIDVEAIADWTQREMRAAPAAYDPTRADLFLGDLRRVIADN